MSKTFIKNTETNIEGVKIAADGTITLPSSITIDGVDLGVFKADYDVKVNQDVRSTASPTFAAITVPTINGVGNAASFTLNSLNFAVVRADGSKFVATPSGSITYLDSRGINPSTAGSFEFRSVSSDNSIFNTVATLSTAGELTVTSLKTSTLKSADGTTLVDISNIGIIKITSGQDQANLTLLAGDVDNYRASRVNFLNYKTNTTAPIWTLISDYVQDGTNDFRLVNASNATVFSVTQAGVVTLGPATGNVAHTVNGSLKSITSSASGQFFSGPVKRFVEEGAPTGAIKITLPLTWSNTMIRFKIKGFNYDDSQTNWEVVVGGYLYTDGPSWIHPVATSTGTNFNGQVRFGHDGTKCCIILGDVTTANAYSAITIEDVDVHFGGGSASEWGNSSLWDIGFISSLSGITFSGTVDNAHRLQGPCILGPAAGGVTHRLNTNTTAASTGSLTLTNAPTGKSGNPAGYITININGTDRVIPYW